MLEREAVAAGASGRNQGVVQHPFDPILATLHAGTLAVYRELADELDVGFCMRGEPAGLLLVTDTESAAAAMAADVHRSVPALRPELLAPEDVRRLEPAMADGIAACRLETGYPVPPGSATRSLAESARRSGARFERAEASPWLEGDRCLGVEVGAGPGAERIAAGSVLLATGAWSGDLDLGGRWPIPIRPLWGAVVSVDLAQPPHHVLEEIGVDSIGLDGGPEAERRVAPSSRIPSIFSLVTAAGVSGVGATVLTERPDEETVGPVLVERGVPFVPALATAARLGVRVCPRPATPDGRPLIGPVPGLDGLYVCAGHGPWGISTGPASARLAAELMLGRDVGIPPEFSPARFLAGAS